MSSANDTYHHLFVQTQPKSILKKSPSPRFLDLSMDSEPAQYSNITVSETHESEKHDIDMNISNNKSVFTQNDNQPVNRNNSGVQIPFTESTSSSTENQCQYQANTQLIRSNAAADSSASHASDNEQLKQQRPRIKTKKTHSRSLVNTDTLSSSDSFSDYNVERKAKRSVTEPRITSRHSNKYRPTNMQLDEFMRKYQQNGGIHLYTTQEHDTKDSITTDDTIKHNGKNRHYFKKQGNSHVDKLIMENDTSSLLESMNAITLSSKTLSPMQLLFDVARTDKLDRRTKIDRIRQYVEEQIGISAFLTIYKLLKSSQMPVNIKQKPFCYYANFIPHLCCLIMLESEQQKTRL